MNRDDFREVVNLLIEENKKFGATTKFGPKQKDVLLATIHGLREDLDATTAKLFLLYKALEARGGITSRELDDIAKGIEVEPVKKTRAKKK